MFWLMWQDVKNGKVYIQSMPSTNSHVGQFVPVMIHADEGTRQKNQGLMTLQWQLGIGHEHPKGKWMGVLLK